MKLCCGHLRVLLFCFLILFATTHAQGGVSYFECVSGDFGCRHKLLVDRLLSQAYRVNWLRSSFPKKLWLQNISSQLKTWLVIGSIYNTLYLSTIVAVCDRCHAWDRQHLLNPEHLVVLSVHPISFRRKEFLWSSCSYFERIFYASVTSFKILFGYITVHTLITENLAIQTGSLQNWEYL